jgi:phosphate-selective porin OprO/OprP
LLFNERSIVSDLLPNRDLGFEVHGDLWNGIVSYAAGVFNGVGDNRSSSNADIEDDKAFAGRLFIHPFSKTSVSALKGFGFGLGGGYENIQGTNISNLPNNTGGILPGYSTVGQQQFFAYNPTNRFVAANGTHWRISPQAYYYWGPFSLLGEYAISAQNVRLGGTGPRTSAVLNNTAWQVSTGWVLTGEDASYTGVTPRHSFDPLHGGWGAWQIAGRFAQLDIDRDAFPLFSNPATSARTAREWSVDLIGYLNRNVRLNVGFSHTWFDGGGGSGAVAPATVTRQDENVLFSRVQLAF